MVFINIYINFLWTNYKIHLVTIFKYILILISHNKLDIKEKFIQRVKTGAEEVPQEVNIRHKILIIYLGKYIFKKY